MARTAGPWIHNGAQGSDKEFLITADPGVLVATSIEDADARLIAAAPELLEALEAMIQHYDENYTVSGMFASMQARSAIRKARGY